MPIMTFVTRLYHIDERSGVRNSLTVKKLPCEHALFQRERETEIDEFDAPTTIDHNVLGLHVPVKETMLVQML